MDAKKYDRDKLVDLLAERATFERSAVDLYDALLEALSDVEDETIASAIEELRRHRDEEQDHAEWLEGLLGELGGKPARGLPDAVHREAGALEGVIRRKRDGAGLLPMLHAMLSAELMDYEAWKMLLEIAQAQGDRAAVRELRTRVDHEEEHLALVRRLMLTLSKQSVSLHAEAGGGRRQKERRGATTRGTQARGAQAGRSKQAARGRGGARQRREDILDVDVSGPARATTDHEKIRRWVEQRGGTPSRVKGTGRRGDIGMLRIDFPGWSGERSLEPVDWDTWLKAFDDNELALIYEERTVNGQPSRFNKLVARDTVRRRQAGEYDAAVHKGRRATTARRGGGARRGSTTKRRTRSGAAARRRA